MSVVELEELVRLVLEELGVGRDSSDVSVEVGDGAAYADVTLYCTYEVDSEYELDDDEVVQDLEIKCGGFRGIMVYEVPVGDEESYVLEGYKEAAEELCNEFSAAARDYGIDVLKCEPRKIRRGIVYLDVEFTVSG